MRSWRIARLASRMAISPEMENAARRQCGIGFALVIRFNQVPDIADPSGGDDGDVDGFGNGAGQRQVETLFRTVPVPPLSRFRPRRVFAFRSPIPPHPCGRIAPAVGKISQRVFFGVDGFGIDTAATMACEPKNPAASSIRSGRVTAAVLMLTCPQALSRRRMSATVRTPPPTVSRMKTCPATSSMMCRMVSRLSDEAVMSRGQFVHALRRCSVWRLRRGRASRKPMKFTPLTTRPSFTSRQGMMRFASAIIGCL